MRTALIHSDEWRRFDYGAEHPLRMERLGLTWKLMEAYGLTGLSRSKVLGPEPAELDAIARYHSRDYIEILRAVSAGDWVPQAARYGLGPGDNPMFPGLWEAAQLAAGGSIRRAAGGRGRGGPAFHFAGGLHHASPTGLLASATSTTPCSPSCGSATAAGAWRTWTSTRITATASSTRSTAIRTS